MRTVFGSCPLDCPDGCSWIVTVEDSVSHGVEERVDNGGGSGADAVPGRPRAVRLRGNPDHPFTAGALCKKVNPWLTIAAEDRRLLTPLRRIAPKGPGVDPAKAFEPIGWDEAIDEIARRFQAIIDRDGPEAIWPFIGTGNVGFVQGAGIGARARLWNALGVSDHHVTICSVSGHFGLGYSMGLATSLDPEHVARAATVVIWGANPLVTSQHWWPFVETARSKGATVVVVDPVRTRTAERADRHLAPRVGTDGALALGLCRELLANGGADRAFLAERTVGFEAFAAEVEPWTPERVAEVCDVAPEAVVELAALLAADPRFVIKLGQGMQRHAHGGQAARTISCIAAITGSFDHQGCGVVYSTDPVYRFNVSGLGRPDLAPGPRRRLAMTNLADNLEGLDDPPIRALFISGANPVVSNPNTDRVRAALADPDLFTVAVELFHTETTDYADIVLPSTMQHEQWEVNHSFAHRYVALNSPAVPPAGECLSHTEIHRRLARALGLDDPALYASDEELVATLLDTPDLRAAGVDIDYLLAHGWAAMPNTDGFHPVAERFPTPSGRFEFASQRAEDDGFGLVASYHPPAEAGVSGGRGGGADDGSSVATYDLVAIGNDGHVNTVFAPSATIAARTADPDVRVNPADARRDGLSDGQRVRIFNDRGGFEATLRVDDATRTGLAATFKGRGAVGLNATVAERDSDMGRGAVFHDNRVRIIAL